MFGRPQLLHAEDIDQEFPAAINDEDLLICPKALSKARVPKDCLMAALIFHAKLALIVAKASREQYSIQRFSGGERVIRLRHIPERSKHGKHSFRSFYLGRFTFRVSSGSFSDSSTSWLLLVVTR